MELSKQRFLDYLFKTFFESKLDENNKLYKSVYDYEMRGFFHNVDTSIDIITDTFGECNLKDVENIIAIECSQFIPRKYVTREKVHILAYRYMGEVMSGIDLGEVND